MRNHSVSQFIILADNPSRMKEIVCVVIILLCSAGIQAQKKDNRLQQQVEALLKGFRGDVGVYVHDLKKNRVVAVHADSVFPTASIVKVPILLGIMDKLEKKELDYHQSMVYDDTILYAGVDILGSFKNKEKIDLSKVLMLMLTTSDNTASLWLQQVAGTGTRINAVLDSFGFKDTRVNSRTPGREASRNQYGWGQTTPREMATLFKRIAEGTLFSDTADAKMLRLLGRNYWDEEGLSQIPADVFVASKNGAVNASRSEAMFVNGKKTPYIFCIFTGNNKDTSWETNNEAWVLTRRLSKLLWDYFN